MVPSLKSAIAALSLALALVSNPGNAAAITLSPDADSYVQKGAATTNFGNAVGLVIKDSGTGTTTRHAYIRFDVSGLVLSHLVAASLDLTVEARNDGGGPKQNYTVKVWGLNNGHAGEAWVEGNGNADNNPAGEIIWSNAPANDTANNNFIGAQATQLASFTVLGTANPGDVYSISGASLVNFLQADTNGLVTLMLRRVGGNGSNNLSFASKESKVRSAAALNLTIVPEAATGLLGLLGMAMLGRRRRAA